MPDWLCEAGCGDPVATHSNTPGGWRCRPGCSCRSNPVRMKPTKLLGPGATGGVGGGTDLGEATSAEKKRKAAIILGILSGIAVASAIAFIWHPFQGNAHGCGDAAEWHLAQADATTGDEATAHREAAHEYLLAEAYGHSCHWKEPTP